MDDIVALREELQSRIERVHVAASATRAELAEDLSALAQLDNDVARLSASVRSCSDFLRQSTQRSWKPVEPANEDSGETLVK